MLTLLTTTGCRPEAFALCERYMARQTYQGPVCWIVVDDGETAQPLSTLPENWSRVVLRPEPFWRPGENTQQRNLSAGLEAAREAGGALRLFIIEDDDWYEASWLETATAALDDVDLVGEKTARWYNVKAGLYDDRATFINSSLRCTAMKGRAIDLFAEQLQQPRKLYDQALWKAAKNRLPMAMIDTRLTVGVKAMPGRPGIAAGHDTALGNPDYDGSVLRRWFGEDAQHYAHYRGGLMDVNDKQMIATRPFPYRTRRLRAHDVFDARARHVDGFIRNKMARFPADDEEIIGGEVRKKPITHQPPPSGEEGEEDGASGKPGDKDRTLFGGDKKPRRIKKKAPAASSKTEAPETSGNDDQDPESGA